MNNLNFFNDDFSKIKFDGIAFDLDGTLFDKDGKISDKILNKIKNYLKLQTQIVFVTGRGIGTTNKLVFENNLNEFSDIFIINYNGGLIRKIPKGIKENNSELIEIILENKLELDFDFFELLKKYELFNKLNFGLNGEKFYSEQKDYVITLVFNKSEFDENGKLNFDLIYEIEKIILENNLDLKVLYTGHTIDIISKKSGKGNSLKFLENFRNKNLFRVGDKGDFYGNDFDMLEYGKGLTVGEGDDKLKIFDENGIQLEREKSINKIFEVINLNNSLKVNISDIKEEDFEFYKNIGKSLEYNSDLKNIFSFEGSIVFFEKDFKKILKKYDFLEKYFVLYGGYYYSRNDYYHFFNEELHTNYEKILKFINYLKNLNLDLLKIYDLENIKENDRKIILGFLDIVKINQIRILQLFSYMVTILEFKEFEKFLPFIKNNLLLFEKNYIDFYNGFDLQKNIYLSYDEDIFNKILKIFENKNFEKHKIIRGTPEANHPYFNNIYGEKVSEKIIEIYGKEKEIYFFGMNYGGIELPYIVDIYLRNKLFSGKINHIGVQYSHYTNTNNLEIEKLFDKNFEKGKVAILFDDGSFTGESLFKVGDFLIKKGFENIEYSTLHFPGDRARQWFINNGGGMNKDFLNYLKEWGLVRVGPFYKNSQKFNLEQQRAQNINNIKK